MQASQLSRYVRTLWNYIFMGDRIWQGRTNFGCQNWSGGDRFWWRTNFFITELTAKLDSITVPGKDKVNVSSSAQQTSISNPTASSNLAQPQQSNFHPADRKFNLVVYGISECPSGMSRPERVKRDLDLNIPILTKLNPEINPLSIQDCFRLGKYTPNLINLAIMLS